MFGKFLYLGILSFGLSQVVTGQDTLKLYYLDEIVVTATRTKRAVKDLSATVSIVTRDEIEQSNANSCTDILNTLPGLFVHKTSAFGRADVTIRGIGQRGRKIMVLIDGRPVKMGLFGCTVTHSLPINNVDHIEVIRGPLSVLYGSDALSGVINIITRQIAEKGIDSDVTLSYGIHNTQQYRLRQGGNLNRFNYYLTGDWRLTDGHLPNSAYDGKDFTAKFGYDIGNIGITLSGKYFDGYKEEPFGVAESGTSDVWNDYERGAIDLTLTSKWQGWDSYFKVYRNFGEHEFSDGWHSKDFTNGAVLNASGRAFTGNELTVGAEFRQQGGERISEPPGEWDKYEYAVFFHDEQLLLKRLIFTCGGRYNYDEISGTDLSPQVGLVYHPMEGTILRGAINKGFRSPQLNELYMLPPSHEAIKPERVWNYEIGLNQRIIEGVNIDIVGYYMKGDNLIQKEANSEPPPRFLFQNTGEFEFKGIETGLITGLGKGFRSKIYYTYLDPGEKTSGRPGNKIDISLRYTMNKLALSLSSQYVTDYFAADSSKEPIDDYFVANTKLSYELFAGLKAFIAVDNILDEEYEIYVDLPGGIGPYLMPKRQFTCGISFKF